MARYFVVGDGGSAASAGGGLFSYGLGFVFMLGMIVMSLSIMSMLILGCADGAHEPKKKKRRDEPKKKKRSEGVDCSCCGDCGDGGDGGGDGGGGGCGGGGCGGRGGGGGCGGGGGGG